MADLNTTYPYNIPASYHFSVKILGFNSDVECSFQEVDGLSVKFEMENVTEGGLNSSVHKFPKRAQYKDLTLKRGLLKGSQALQWINNAMNNFIFEPKAIYISLLDEQNKPTVKWWVKDAYPIGIEISPFKAQENSIVFETLFFAYDSFVRTG